MIVSLHNFSLPIEDVTLLEREFQCHIHRNPVNGWWTISTPSSEDMPIILSWINALKGRRYEDRTLAGR